MNISSEMIDEARRNNPIRDVLSGYSSKVNRQGFCSCPIHQGDNTASLKVYPDGTFHCFGCHAHGDVIDLVRLITGCSFSEALTVLGVDTNIQMNWVDERRLKQERAERKILTEKIQKVREIIERLDMGINEKSRQIRFCFMSEEDFTEQDESRAVQAENERMSLYARRSNAEQILRHYEEQYNERYKRVAIK